MQDKTVVTPRKIPVKMVQTKKATDIKNGPGGQQRFTRLIDSANVHATDVISRAKEKAAWCAVTIEADLVMIHLNLKDVSKAYAYLFSFDEFYTKDDQEFKGYSLITHSLMGYQEKDVIVSSRTLVDD